MKMKQMKKLIAENETCSPKQGVSMPPPPPPPLPTKTCKEFSVTNREIAKFWRKKRMEEEEHLLAAIKAAARVRARRFSEHDYNSFLKSLEQDDANEQLAPLEGDTQKSENEVWIGIKDWWTKSNYAYLNQPAIGSADNPRRRTSSYTPNCFSYKPAPTPLYPTSLGVF